MTPQRLRAYVLIMVRDVATPLTGLFLSVWLPVTGHLEPWHLPLLAGMLGTPLVARGDPLKRPADKLPGGSEDGVP